MRILFTLLLLPTTILSSTPPFSCDPSTQHYPFCNPSLPINRRAEDLVSRLSLEEKIAQLGDIAPPIPRLGVPGYKWWSEGLHGVSNTGRGIRFNGSIHSATSFPQVILTAASFNWLHWYRIGQVRFRFNGSIHSATSFPQVILTAASFNWLHWYRIGQAIGIEARAIYNVGQADELTFWTPNINIFRDPRWGRGQETPGEDPLTSSKYAAVFVRGLQGDNYEGEKRSPGLIASACCKHFTAYDLDNWKGIQRYTFDAKVTLQDLQDTYQPPFKSCVEKGHASGIMCSYNRVNGVPTCADYNLLSTTARGLWGFYGYITSDCDAVSIIYESQKYAKTPEDAVADVLKAGMDVNCGTYVQQHAGSAVQQGKLSEGDINRALNNLFSVRMRLGLFDGNPEQRLYGNIAPNQVCTLKHQYLALEAARDGIVLLKNLDGLLPLSRSKVASLGVIGPNGNNFTILKGNYAGPPCVSSTPFQVLQSYVKDSQYVAGCNSVACESSSIDEAVKLARSVDHVILFMGLDQSQEREDHDRVDLTLPGMQQSLISRVAEAAKKPVILVLLCGGPVDVTFARDDLRIGSILWAGYPGEAGGLAIAEIIFGEHNPGGRLPVTWYPQAFTSVPMTDMRMRADPATGYPGRTYRFYTGQPVFKYGYGLSYSTYSYEFKSVAENPVYMNNTFGLQTIEKSGHTSYSVGPEACQKMKLSAVIRVKNEGKMAGRHPVLLFLRRPPGLRGRPREQLIGFESVHLEGGEGINVKFVLKPCEHLSHIEEDGSKVLDKGIHILVVGNKEHQINVLA